MTPAHSFHHNKNVPLSPLITGTLMLTIGGLITRILGFFNRIYLSQLIGAKEMGIYQLIFPVYMTAFAFCCHGIELALSQMIAADDHTDTQAAIDSGNRKGKIRRHTSTVHHSDLIRTAFILTFICALSFSLSIYYLSDFISIYLLKEESCSICLKLMAPVLPFTAVRCCLHGYYIGRKQTLVPAVGQLIEQVCRIFIIWLIAESYKDSISFGAPLAVCGMVIGEIAGTVYTCISYKIYISKKGNSKSFETVPSGKMPDLSSNPHRKYQFFSAARELLNRAVPLTGNKLSLTLASGLESVLIPFMLTKYYHNRESALSIYGILTGMALPFIMFPSTLTNSLSVVLLPTVSTAHAHGKEQALRHTIRKTAKLCLSLGFAALIFFSLFGRQFGELVFHNQTAGDFLFRLSFLCPLLYLSSSASSILNGFGCMKQSFFYNLTGIAIRIGFIILTVPKFGIQGYLIGLLAGQIVMTGLQWNKIRRSW